MLGWDTHLMRISSKLVRSFLSNPSNATENMTNFSTKTNHDANVVEKQAAILYVEAQTRQAGVHAVNQEQITVNLYACHPLAA